MKTPTDPRQAQIVLALLLDGEDRTNEELAEALDSSTRTVRRATTQLMEAGLINHGWTERPRLWRLSEGLKGDIRKTSGDLESATGVQNTATGVTEAAPIPDAGGHHSSTRAETTWKNPATSGQIPDTGGQNRFGPSVAFEDLSGEDKEKKNILFVSPTERDHQRTAASPEAFGAWWNQYARRAFQPIGRSEAYAAWLELMTFRVPERSQELLRAAELVTPRRIRAALMANTAGLIKTGEAAKYLPGPAKFLRSMDWCEAPAELEPPEGFDLEHVARYLRGELDRVEGHDVGQARSWKDPERLAEERNVLIPSVQGRMAEWTEWWESHREEYLWLLQAAEGRAGETREGSGTE